MDERRRHKRYSVLYPVETVEGEGDSSVVLMDVSISGISFKSKKAAAENDKFEVRLFLKNKMFVLTAKVVYIKPESDSEYTIGAQFLAVPEDFAAALEKEIDEIKQLYRQRTLYNHHDISFRKASAVYLENAHSSNE
ncbi:MAG: PilZ domain-containing protein [Candidatus Omnitrophota bacterium]